MASLVLDQDRAIIKLGASSAVVSAIVAGIFLVIGCAILAFLIKLWSTTGFDPRILINLLNGESPKYILLVPLIIGTFFTLIPLIAIISLFSGKNKPAEPKTLVFDNFTRRFSVFTRPWDATTWSTVAASLPFYSYNQLQNFRVRTYTTSSSSKSGHKRATSHYVVCLVKKDGGLWDLYEGLSKTDAQGFLDRLQQAVRLDDSETVVGPGAGDNLRLPERIVRVEAGGGVFFYWKNTVPFGGLSLGLLLAAAFFVVIFKLATDALPFVIIAGLITLVVSAALLKGFWDSLVSVHNYHCLRLQGNSLQTGLIPKARLKNSQGTDGAHPQTITSAFKSLKSLDISTVSRVQYSWRMVDRQTQDQELLLMGKKAAKASDDSSQATIKNSTMTIILSKLSVGETMVFERILEQELARHGGQAELV